MVSARSLSGEGACSGAYVVDDDRLVSQDVVEFCGHGEEE